MKIAILGGSGYIGLHLCSIFLRKGHEVICIARKEKIFNFSQDKKYRFLKYDIYSSPDNLNLFNFFNEPDIVIDAAWGDLDDYSSEKHISLILEAHYKTIQNLVKFGLKSLTILGTCSEYGLQEGELNENIETFPVTNYAKSKDLLRKKLLLLKEKKSFLLQWPRIFYFFGENQPRGAIFSQLIAANNGTFNMSCGKQIRDYLHIDDVVLYLYKISTSKHDIGVINVCSGNAIMLKDTVKKWVESYKLNVEINLCFYDYPDFEPFAFWGGLSKLKRYCNEEK